MASARSALHKLAGSKLWSESTLGRTLTSLASSKLFGNAGTHPDRSTGPVPLLWTPSRRNHLAATLKKFGEPLQVVEVKKELAVGKGEVEVRVDSAGVNTADVLMTQDIHHVKPKLPVVPGFELAGEIVKVGDGVERFKVGDRVLGFRRKGTGAFAQNCVLHEEVPYWDYFHSSRRKVIYVSREMSYSLLLGRKFQEVFPIPYSLKYEQAASLPLAYGSAYLAFQKVASTSIKEGWESGKEHYVHSRSPHSFRAYVLVLSNNGSTGLAAIDLAQNYFRCKVIAATESEEKCAVVRPLGVLATVEYPDENLPKSVRKATEGKGVDVVIDTVGGKWSLLALQCLKPGGHLCSLGFSSGEIPDVNLQELIRLRLTVSGVWLGGYAEENPQKFHDLVEKIIQFRDKGYISPHPATCYPLDQVNDALFSPAAKDTLGKVVLTLR